MKTPMKPCPFCGGEAHTNYIMTQSRWKVACRECKGQTSIFLDRNDAIKAWNKRTTTSVMEVETSNGKITMTQNGDDCLQVGYVRELTLG